MNICFVSQEFPVNGNFDSGIGRYLFELTKELKKKHNIVILTVSDETSMLQQKNLTIYTIARLKKYKRSLNFLIHLFQVATTLTKIIKKHKIDLIEFANWESEGLIFTSTINKFLNIPIVIRLHTPTAIDQKFNNRPKYFSEKLVEYCEKLFVNQQSNILITSTKYNAKECRKVYKITNKKIEIVPLGIKPNNLIYKHLTTQSTPVTILFVGRLEPRKGVDILLKTITLVLKKNNNIHFVIVGRENANHQWLTTLKKQIPYQFLYKINFLGYIGSARVLEKLYQQADICIVPSRYESLGLTVLDGMNYGKVTVASKVGGIPEIITNGFDGILVNKLTPKSFASGIIKATDPKLQRLVFKNASVTVNRKFNIKITSLKTIEFYNHLIGQL